MEDQECFFFFCHDNLIFLHPVNKGNRVTLAISPSQKIWENESKASRQLFLVYFGLRNNELRQAKRLTRILVFPILLLQLKSNSRSIKCFFFFSIWVFSHDHSRITGLQGKEEGISLTPHYHFHPLHRQLDISRAIAAESSPLHIACSRTRTGNLWLPSASR